tara:strand:+ start:2666 stop:3475 length:810 start_codon:yes stop_codon:yes gene_type:complete
MQKNIVVTGSTRGIGYGLALEFTRLGAKVVINGRKQADVDLAIENIAKSLPEKTKPIGFAGDITKYEDVENLWQRSRAELGRVDIWINNAGVINHREPTWKLQAENIAQTVSINMIGMMYCSKVALKGMLQQGSGHLYNFEGFGSDGRQWQPGMTPYGSTKAAVRYFTKGLVKETKGTPVKVGTISPGIVVTDLLRQPYEGRPDEWKKAKKIFNILGDKVETVTPWIAEKVLQDTQSGTKIAWLGVPRVMGKFLSASFTKRNLFEEIRA